jgi:chaperonin GroES
MASSVKYQPIFARVLIKREINEKSSGGIIIPNAKRHATAEGEILALGETASEILKVGQKVRFGKHSGAWLDPSDKEGDEGTLFICQDEDILAIISE